LRERIVPLTPLLSEEFFDKNSSWPHLAKYEAYLYVVKATRFEQLYQATADLGRAWSNIADVFVIQLTLLTVALSLYGLSITMRGFIRWMFVFVGSGLVLFCVLWMGWKLLEPLPVISEEAIDAFAEGYGQYYQGNNAEAIALYNKALSINPDYADAIYERGYNNLVLGNYEAAVSDFLVARDLGLDGEYTYWNLGWTYYLMGRFDDAIEANNVILNSNPSIIGMRSNQALNYLAKGDLERARREYDSVVGEIQKQVSNKETSDSLWYYVDAASLDLQNLVDRLSESSKDWTEAPPAEMVLGDHAHIIAFAQEQIVRLKESILALEYTGSLPQAQEVMQVSPFAFGNVTFDAEGYISDFEVIPDAVFPNDTAAVSIQFTYTGSVPQDRLIWKFYLDGEEYAAFRAVSDTDLSSSDTWYQTVGFNYTNLFFLPPGEYTVELYGDYRLVQTGRFYVQP
ncbi:MAG TPA: tetratricopeptide repeat protein, partial [Anaerolineales bacterium]|nr:tetratricopeptide repeat protein [Anaerolineales bacterium]